MELSETELREDEYPEILAFRQILVIGNPEKAEAYLRLPDADLQGAKAAADTYLEIVAKIEGDRPNDTALIGILRATLMGEPDKAAEMVKALPPVDANRLDFAAGLLRDMILSKRAKDLHEQKKAEPFQPAVFLEMTEAPPSPGRKE